MRMAVDPEAFAGRPGPLAMDEPEAQPIDDAAVDVSETAAVYAAETERFVEKYCDRSLVPRYGDAFRDALPTRPSRPARILDVGCGPGVDTAAFAEAGLDVVGLDITAPFLRTARREAPAASFLRGDMRRLPFTAGSIDGLWSSASFLHLPRSAAPDTLAAFARVLADDGALLLSVMAREPRGVGAAELPDGRRFTFWQKDALLDHLHDAGFRTNLLSEEPEWHAVLAVRD